MPEDEENPVCFCGYKNLPSSPWYNCFGAPVCWKSLYFLVYIWGPVFVYCAISDQRGFDESLMPVWKTAECQPSYAVKGIQCCYSWNSSLLDRSCGIYGNVPNYYSNVYSECGNSGKALPLDSVNRDNCETDYGISAWPRGEFSENFIISNSTFKCYTDCETFSLKQKEEKKLLSANMTIGWGGMYFPAILQTIQYAITKDNALGLYLHFAMLIYASSGHCACLVKDNHPAVYSGYVMFLISPVLVLLIAFILKRIGRNSFDHTGEFLIFMYALCCICLMCTGITLEGVFRADFCMAQHIVLLGFTTMSLLFWTYLRISTYIRIKNEPKRQNKENLATIRRVEDRWLQIKDVIYPLIDEREMVWDIIWTYYYGMEKEFSAVPKGGKIKDVQDELSLISDYWAVDPFLSSGKCYTFAAIQADLEYGKSLEGNTINLDIVANSIGNCNFHYGDFTKDHSKKTKLIAFNDKSEGGWGVAFFTNNSGSIVKVAKIYKGSQFEKKGVKSGWTINRVNKLEVCEANGTSIQEILSAGAKCEIQFSWKKFKRGDRVMSINEKDVSGIFVKYKGEDKCHVKLLDGTIKSFPEWKLVEAEVNLKEIVADIAGDDATNKRHTRIPVKGRESNLKLIPSKVQSSWKENLGGEKPLNEKAAREIMKTFTESDSTSLDGKWTKSESRLFLRALALCAKNISGMDADKDFIFCCLDRNDDGFLDIEEIVVAVQAMWLMHKKEIAFEQFLGDKPQEARPQKDVYICHKRFQPGDSVTLVNTKKYEGLSGIFENYIEGNKCRVQFASLGATLRIPTRCLKKTRKEKKNKDCTIVKETKNHLHVTHKSRDAS